MKLCVFVGALMMVMVNAVCNIRSITDCCYNEALNDCQSFNCGANFVNNDSFTYETPSEALCCIARSSSPMDCSTYACINQVNSNQVFNTAITNLNQCCAAATVNACKPFACATGFINNNIFLTGTAANANDCCIAQTDTMACSDLTCIGALENSNANTTTVIKNLDECCSPLPTFACSAFTCASNFVNNNSNHVKSSTLQTEGDLTEALCCFAQTDTDDCTLIDCGRAHYININTTYSCPEVSASPSASSDVKDNSSATLTSGSLWFSVMVALVVSGLR